MYNSLCESFCVGGWTDKGKEGYAVQLSFSEEG